MGKREEGAYHRGELLRVKAMLEDIQAEQQIEKDNILSCISDGADYLVSQLQEVNDNMAEIKALMNQIYELIDDIDSQLETLVSEDQALEILRSFEFQNRTYDGHTMSIFKSESHFDAERCERAIKSIGGEYKGAKKMADDYWYIVFYLNNETWDKVKNVAKPKVYDLTPQPKVKPKRKQRVLGTL